MNKKAFTLIELLVVIAIIAILAAILFPVFAQAKLAAKKTASLSNIKQITLGELMYQNDYDDMLVLSLSGDYSDLGCPEVASRCAHALPQPSHSWVMITQPYIKNMQLLVDPGVGDGAGVFTGSGPNNWHRNWDRLPEYGYNYLFLSPFWQCVNALARSSTASIRPSQTVMFTSSTDFTGAKNVGFFDSDAPGAWPITAPANNACIFYDGTTGSGNWSAANPANVGKLTASVRAVYPYGGGLIGWLDGHAKFVTDGALAAGTDYGTAVYNNANSGAQILNINNYIWTLDGTTTDLSL